MLGIEGILDDSGDFHGQALHVEGLGAGLGDRVHNVVLRALGIFPGIPELVGILEPVGADGGAEDHVVDLLGGELVRQGVIRLLGRRENAAGNDKQQAEE